MEECINFCKKSNILLRFTNFLFKSLKILIWLLPANSTYLNWCFRYKSNFWRKKNWISNNRNWSTTWPKTQPLSSSYNILLFLLNIYITHFGVHYTLHTLQTVNNSFFKLNLIWKHNILHAIKGKSSITSMKKPVTSVKLLRI